MKQGLQVNQIFSDNMVLQRREPIEIWGTCEKDAEVAITIAEKNIVATVDATSWIAVLPAMEKTEKVSMVITSGREKIEINNIAIGDVWLAGGQSNMEFYMRYDADYKSEVEQCENADIRFYDVPEVCYAGQEEEFDYSRMGYWRTCDKKNLEYYSAVAYYFAKNIQAELNVPIGIIGCNRGDSIGAAWIPEEIAAKHGQIWLDEFKQKCDGKSVEDWIDACRKHPMMDRGNPFADAMSDELLYGISHEKQKEIMAGMQPEAANQPGPDVKNRPGSLYECMFAQVSKLRMKGILWYQGESDVLHAEIYKEVLSDLIDCWREHFGRNTPFLMVQIAPFGEWIGCVGTDFPILRKVQREVSVEKEKVYLISTSDVGMKYDIHPKKKKPVGERLALCARAHVYKENILSDAPVFDKVECADNEIHIHFKNAGTGLHFEGDSENMLFINGVSYTQDKMKISNEVLVVSLKDEERNVKSIVIEFASSDYYKVNLYNSANIPAMPFVCDIE